MPVEIRPPSSADRAEQGRLWTDRSTPNRAGAQRAHRLAPAHDTGTRRLPAGRAPGSGASPRVARAEDAA